MERDLSAPILITGGAGQLARDLAALLPGSHAPDRHQLSITDADQVKSAVERTGARLVFNCAAYNAVDRAESSPDEAFAVNATGAGNVARACREAGARLVHFSTNYVFSGDAEEPYLESDIPDPRSVYGRSKQEGEELVLAAFPQALVIRSSGLFGHNGSAVKGGSFPDRIVARAGDRLALTVVDDQHLNPTYTGHLAQAALSASQSAMAGVLHLVAQGCCSFHEFATEVLTVAGIEAEVLATRTTGGPGIAPRPRNGCLKSEHVSALPSWRDGLVAFWRSRPPAGG